MPTLERLGADDLASVKGSGPPFEGCVRELLWYRFYAVEFLTREIPLERIDDIGILVHRLMARGSHVDPVVAPRIAAIAERILELDPKNADAARAALLFRYVAFRSRRTDPRKLSRERLAEFRTLPRMMPASGIA